MTQTIARQRLYSLDALRDFDMFWIMGSDEIVRSDAKTADSPFMITISHQMEHLAWDGFYFYDLIFPPFLFIAGVAIPYSVGKKLETGVVFVFFYIRKKHFYVYKIFIV